MTINITKVPEKQLKTIETGGLTIVEKAETLNIENDVVAEEAALVLKDIKISLKDAEDLRKSFTQPINQSLKAINVKFKEATEPLKTAETIIKQKVLKWQKSENKRIEKEETRRQKIQEAHYKKGHDVSPLAKLDRVEKVGSTHMRKVKKWKLVDFGKLPDEYKVANDVLLNKLVRGGKTDILGIEIYEDDVLAVR